MSSSAPRTRGLVWSGLTSRGRVWFGVTALGLIAALIWVPVAALAGAVVVGLLRRRPDRLLGLLTLGLGLVLCGLAWSVGPSYAAAWSRLWAALERGGVGTVADWSPLVGWSLVIGPAVGAVWWRLDQAWREAQPMAGRIERQRRRRIEGDRARWVTHAVQEVRHTGRAPYAAVVRPLAVPLGTRSAVVVGRLLEGDLRWPSVRGRPGLLVLPPAVRHLVLLGATRQGKSELAFRRMEWRITQPGHRVILLNCKQPAPHHEPALRLAQAAERSGRSFRALVRDVSGWDPMRGTTDQIRQRLLATQEWGDAYYEHVSNVLLGLALDLSHAQGRPLESLPDLVWTLLRDDLAKLAETNDEARQLRTMLGDRETSGAVLRWASNALQLRGWVQPAEAGGWSWEDADVIAVDLPTSTEPGAARMLLRAMLTDLEGWITDPKRRPDGPLLLTIEEVSALDADPVLGRRLVNLSERAAGAGVDLTIVAQGPSGLGDERAIEALLTNSAVITTQQTDSAAVERLVSLAGTEDREEASAAYGGTVGIAPGSGSIRAQESWKVHPNRVRTLARGEVIVLMAGRWARVAVAMTEAGYVRPSGPAVEALAAAYGLARLRAIGQAPDSPAELADEPEQLE